MPRRTPVLAAVFATAALAAGLAPAAASADAGGIKPVDPGQSEYAAQSIPPVVTGRPDGDGDGRKNR